VTPPFALRSGTKECKTSLPTGSTRVRHITHFQSIASPQSLLKLSACGSMASQVTQGSVHGHILTLISKINPLIFREKQRTAQNNAATWQQVFIFYFHPEYWGGSFVQP